MPLDVAPQRPLTLAGLVWRLRHPDTWPAGFRWDYTSPCGCGMGLAVELLGIEVGLFRSWSAAVALAFPEVRGSHGHTLNDVAYRAFFRLLLDREHVTPDDVADALEPLLSKETTDAV